MIDKFKYWPLMPLFLGFYKTPHESVTSRWIYFEDYNGYYPVGDDLDKPLLVC